MKNPVMLCFISGLIFWGCSSDINTKIPGIPEDDPANKFYEFVSRNMAADNVCRDYQGDPGIPMGEVAEGKGYERSKDLLPGAFRFSDKKTGKKYLGVSYLQYQGLMQLPKLCSWEEPVN